MKMLTRLGYLVQEQGMTFIADMDTDNPLASLQAAACTYRIALGPRAGEKVLNLRTVAGRDEKETQALCAEAHGFSLHAGGRCSAHQRKDLERLCHYITRPAHACGGQSGSKSPPTGRRRDRPIRVRGNFSQNSAQINHFSVR